MTLPADPDLTGSSALVIRSESQIEIGSGTARMRADRGVHIFTGATTDCFVLRIGELPAFSVGSAPAEWRRGA